MSRLENTPSRIEIARMMAAMVDLFCASYRRPAGLDRARHRRHAAIVVHGHQQLSLFNAHYDERCFLPIHIYEAGSGKPVAVILREGKTPGGTEVRTIIRARRRAAFAGTGPRPASAGAATATTGDPRPWIGARPTASITCSGWPATRCSMLDSAPSPTISACAAPRAATDKAPYLDRVPLRRQELDPRAPRRRPARSRATRARHPLRRHLAHIGGKRTA